LLAVEKKLRVILKQQGAMLEIKTSTKICSYLLL